MNPVHTRTAADDLAAIADAATATAPLYVRLGSPTDTGLRVESVKTTSEVVLVVVWSGGTRVTLEFEAGDPNPNHGVFASLGG